MTTSVNIPMQRLHDCGSAICHCPSSNLFLGSGLFPLKRLQQMGVNVTMGTDVGGGTSLSMLSTQGDAYKIQQMAGAARRLHFVPENPRRKVGSLAQRAL